MQENTVRPVKKGNTAEMSRRSELKKRVGCPRQAFAEQTQVMMPNSPGLGGSGTGGGEAGASGDGGEGCEGTPGGWGGGATGEGGPVHTTETYVGMSAARPPNTAVSAARTDAQHLRKKTQNHGSQAQSRI